ncbi:MAG: cation:proton antiporter [Gemmatimonadaceae bacterium]|nr:cation:proton antiporter [Gemmatimonadaceae bacterium]
MSESRVSFSHYALLVGLPVVLVLAMIKVGTFTLPVIPALADVFPEVARSAPATTQRGFTLGLLVGQLVVVLLAAQAFGWIARRLGQPTVVGEMVAGIVLGPSVIGALQPQWTAALFPAGSLGFLNALSQLGVLLFLFVVGLHVDLRSLRGQSGTAVIASHASIAAPFTLGVLLAFWLFPRFSPAGVPFAAFALFVGVAMSITAFPVLARILEERGMLSTPLGALAIACAAVDDVTAWILLAVVVALVQAGGVDFTLAVTLFGTAAFVLAMFYVMRPMLQRLTRTRVIGQRVSSATMAVIMIVVLLAAFATELLGIHALFGAFVAGAVMPRDNGFNDQVADQLSDLLVVLLLPLFFAYTGLRTHFDLLGGFEDLIFLGAILAVAIGGKVFGTAIAARAGGQPWREATVLGLLMNTRGLMELVVLNIGLDLGVLSPRLFAMMVIMALVTTAMTVPAIAVYDRWRRPLAAG